MEYRCDPWAAAARGQGVAGGRGRSGQWSLAIGRRSDARDCSHLSEARPTAAAVARVAAVHEEAAMVDRRGASCSAASTTAAVAARHCLPRRTVECTRNRLRRRTTRTTASRS